VRETHTDDDGFSGSFQGLLSRLRYEFSATFATREVGGVGGGDSITGDYSDGVTESKGEAEDDEDEGDSGGGGGGGGSNDDSSKQEARQSRDQRIGTARHEDYIKGDLLVQKLQAVSKILVSFGDYLGPHHRTSYLQFFLDQREGGADALGAFSFLPLAKLN
jgi:hypothetical protein